VFNYFCSQNQPANMKEVIINCSKQKLITPENNQPAIYEELVTEETGAAFFFTDSSPLGFTALIQDNARVHPKHSSGIGLPNGCSDKKPK
jgi:hypothetical protein